VRRRNFSSVDQRTYERSNAIGAIRVPPHPVLVPRTLAIDAALEIGDRRRVQAASQALLDALCILLRVAPLRVEVCGIRPTNHYGELHGLYTPAATDQKRDRVQVWMHTARRRQVVAFKTFLRTLIHELGHHLDYEYLKLSRSFHTEGFYKRESSLVYQLLPSDFSSSKLRPRPASNI
jgi:hypothetical protein